MARPRLYEGVSGVTYVNRNGRNIPLVKSTCCVCGRLHDDRLENRTNKTFCSYECRYRMSLRKKKQTASPAKIKQCHNIVYQAIKSGRLLRKPCEVCGKEESDSHHDDYDKPLDVRWLCRSCHMTFHSFA